MRDIENIKTETYEQKVKVRRYMEKQPKYAQKIQTQQQIGDKCVGDMQDIHVFIEDEHQKMDGYNNQYYGPVIRKLKCMKEQGHFRIQYERNQIDMLRDKIMEIKHLVSEKEEELETCVVEA
mmetsp:Transcript_1380/g.1223  ORF Transcript_1380/g.1223 Transcript_1380/m.1223 type:complete len:122 (-) Transcript_1380:165-530(-)